MIRAIIVDDEPLAQNVILQFANEIPGLKIICTCNNALEASSKLKDNPVDLMFLDVNMPRLSGLELLKNLTNPPLVILTTAYSDYAMEGYLSVFSKLFRKLRINFHCDKLIKMKMIQTISSLRPTKKPFAWSSNPFVTSKDWAITLKFI